ncbi:glycosyl hydrolase family 28-related protein [Haloferula sp. A504]|uniref:glycosyl hydrolase family 28-related protein n=1 Tax=Haloferula sp. A504 TaxID=3373601 RepID=UPI0031C4E8B8|nr:glycoside hydrolase family 55 protein [Verrucomicrobiaceae bacterium E54]
MNSGFVLTLIVAWLFVPLVPVHAATFNVTDYGAVGDDSTDNTAAFAKCIEKVIAAGGGRMYFPDGVYRGRIIIPPQGGPGWITIEIVGESEPTPVFGTIGSFPPQNGGTIVKSLETSGAAVISAPPGNLYMGFSGVYVVIRNLNVRTYDNPRISGIDLNHAAQCRLENVVVSTGVYNVQASQPTHGKAGLVTPANNNAALTILRNVLVTGYDTGIVVNEHTDADNIVVASNIHGIKFNTANHASRFGRIGTYRNTHHVTVAGRHGFLIQQMNTEQPGPRQTNERNAWQKLVSDVNDPASLGTGDINYWVVVGNVGPVDTFTKIGGSGIRARRIGSAP